MALGNQVFMNAPKFTLALMGKYGFRSRNAGAQIIKQRIILSISRNAAGERVDHYVGNNWNREVATCVEIRAVGSMAGGVFRFKEIDAARETMGMRPDKYNEGKETFGIVKRDKIEAKKTMTEAEFMAFVEQFI